MAVFRVERTRDYTVMCNHHLKDSNLSLKAKGLLSMMLSLPDEWNYTTRGLAAICKEGVDAIGKTLKELELAGYIIRRQLRGKDGRISDTEYTIFEKPRKPSPPDTTLPDTENPYLDNPDTEAPDTDNPAQLNTKKSNTQKSNTDLSSTHSFFLPAADGMTDGLEKKAEIREQIEYDILCQQYDRMQLDELVEIMLEVAMNRSPTVKIGRDENSGEFTYFAFSPDTMETTYHLEFRYAEDLNDLQSWFEGNYAYWNAAAIAEDYDQATMENVIELFATENLSEAE